jgi:hypothetical protein
LLASVTKLDLKVYEANKVSKDLRELRDQQVLMA